MNKSVSPQSSREVIGQVLIYAAMLTPLIVATPYAIFPFVFPKAIFFEAVVAVLAAVVVPLLMMRGTDWYKNVYARVLAGYAVILVLSGVFAFAPQRAFWSNFERMTGIVFILTGILFSLIIAGYFSEAPARVKSFLEYIVGISVVVSLLGLYQLVDRSFLIGQPGRIAGTFGNPIYLGGFAAQFAIIAAYFTYQYRNSSRKWFYGAATIINFLAVYYSGTRSAMLGLVVALVFIGVYVSQLIWKAGYKKQIAGLWIAAVIGIAGLFALPVFFPSLSASSSPLLRFVSFSAGGSTGSTRVIAWEIAIKGFTERPLLGWGPENFYYVFNKFYNPKSLSFGMYETWFDHAHNSVFDVLVTQGLIGLLFYLAQYGVVFWMCYKTRGTTAEENILSVALASIFILHFVHNLFVFDHPGSYVEFYALAGIVAARYIVRTRAQQLVSSNRSVAVGNNVTISNGVTVACLLLGAYIVIPAVRQNNLDFKGQHSAGGNIVSAQQYFQRAIDVNGPFTTDVLLDTARIAQKIPLATEDNRSFLTIPEFRKYFEFTVGNLDLLLKQKDPANVLGALMQGQLLMAAFEAGDASAGQKADRAFAYATQLSPDRQQIVFAWARLKLLQNDSQGAVKLLQEAVNKEPSISTGHWYLANAIVDKNPKAAAHEIDIIISHNDGYINKSNRVFAAFIFAKADRTEDAAKFFEEALVDVETSSWYPEGVLVADQVFEKTGRTEMRKRLRVQFANLFKDKK